MKVWRITWQHRNDFNAVVKCEHCGHEQEDRGLYSDAFYFERVLPARHYCGGCGKNGLGQARPVPEPSPAAPVARPEARGQMSESIEGTDHD